MSNFEEKYLAFQRKYKQDLKDALNTLRFQNIDIEDDNVIQAWCGNVDTSKSVYINGEFHKEASAWLASIPYRNMGRADPYPFHKLLEEAAQNLEEMKHERILKYIAYWNAHMEGYKARLGEDEARRMVIVFEKI